MYLKGRNIPYDSLWFKEENNSHSRKSGRAEKTEGIDTITIHYDKTDLTFLAAIMYFKKFLNGLRNKKYVHKRAVIISIFIE